MEKNFDIVFNSEKVHNILINIVREIKKIVD